MKKKPSILKNSAWNGFSTVTGMILLVITTPVYLRLLGGETFGLYMLLAGVMAPFEILNAGVAQSTVKYVAQWLAQGRVRDAANILRVNVLLNVVASAIAIITLWLAAPWLAMDVFKISEAMRADAVQSFRAAGFVWGLIQLSQTTGAVAVAQQDFRLSSIANTVRLVLLYAGGLLPALWFRTAFALQLWNAILLAGLTLFWAVHAVHHLGRRAVVPGFDREAFRHSFGYSGWQMLNALFGTLTQQSDRLLLGALLGTTAVGIYGIANNAQQRLVTLCWSLFGSLMPAISAKEQEPLSDRQMLLGKGWPLMIFSGWLYAFAMLYSDEAAVLWLGAEVGREVGFLLKALLGLAVVAVPSALIAQFLLGRGLTRLNFLGNIGLGIVTAVASFFSIRAFGVQGAVWGALVGIVISRPVLHYVAVHHHLRGEHPTLGMLWLCYSPVASVLLAVAVAFGVKICCLRMLPPPVGIISSFPLSLLFLVATSLALESAWAARWKDTLALVHSLGRLCERCLGKIWAAAPHRS